MSERLVWAGVLDAALLRQIGQALVEQLGSEVIVSLNVQYGRDDPRCGVGMRQTTPQGASAALRGSQSKIEACLEAR